MNNNELIEIFEGKTFQDLTKDIYDNAKNKQKQIDLLIQEVHSLIQNIEDVALIGPIIKELMDVSVKNDEHLVKLLGVLQRIITRSQTGNDEDSFSLSEKEKSDLMSSLKETATSLQKESDKISEVGDAN